MRRASRAAKVSQSVVQRTLARLRGGGPIVPAALRPQDEPQVPAGHKAPLYQRRATCWTGPPAALQPLSARPLSTSDVRRGTKTLRAIPSSGSVTSRRCRYSRTSSTVVRFGHGAEWLPVVTFAEVLDWCIVEGGVNIVRFKDYVERCLVDAYTAIDKALRAVTPKDCRQCVKKCGPDCYL